MFVANRKGVASEVVDHALLRLTLDLRHDLLVAVKATAQHDARLLYRRLCRALHARGVGDGDQELEQAIGRRRRVEERLGHVVLQRHFLVGTSDDGHLHERLLSRKRRHGASLVVVAAVEVIPHAVRYGEVQWSVRLSVTTRQNPCDDCQQVSHLLLGFPGVGHGVLFLPHPVQERLLEGVT